MLDPALARQRDVLADWLAFQRRYALLPEAGLDQLLRLRSLAAALRAVSQPVSARDRRDVDTLARLGAVAVPLASSAYPPGLAVLRDPAVLLQVRGDPDVLRGPAVAIVGARAATAYGRRTARRLGAELATAGFVVVSGLARGIDAEAHLGALDAGAPTIAVLACGIDRVYPPEHAGLARRIVAAGAVVSEMPLGTHPRRPYFPLRNRLISGLASGVVIVEARQRSGSLITAVHAANQGRDVFAVPGPVDAPTSAGPNGLLRDGARITIDARDVLDELGIVAPVTAAPRRGSEPWRDSALLAALRDEPATRDELGRRLGRPPEQLALELLEHELDGRVTEDRDGRLVIVDLPEHK